MGKELELAIKIGGKLDKSLSSAVNSAQAQLSKIGNTANKIGMAVTGAVVAAGVKLVVDSVNTYKEYQSALNSAAATAGVERGTTEYEMLDAAAREAGRTTVKTAAESAAALEYMALAGWSVENSTKALMPVLKLSAATNTDLATTSDLVTDSMANLGLGINDLNHYLDVSAAANNKSNQTAMQLQEAYLGVGGTLKNLNTPIEESAAVLGVLANRGTKGSEAGTALSAILVNMQKQTGEAAKAMSKLDVSMYDANGKARSIIDVFQEINDKTAGMTEEQRNLMYQMIGGKSHVDSFSKIMAGFNDTAADGQKEVYSLIQSFQNCDGALDKLYGIKTDTLEGSLATLNSAFDDMKINIGEKISPMLNDAVKDLTAKMPDIEKVIVGSLEKIIPAMSRVLDYVVNNADKIISTVTGIAKAFIAFKAVSGAVNGINGMITLFTSLSKIAKSAGAAKTISGVIGALTGSAGTVAGSTAAVSGFGGALTGLFGSVIATSAPAIAGVGGFALAVAALAKYSDFKNYHWADSMLEQSQQLNTQTAGLRDYINTAQELKNIEMVLKNPDSSKAEVEAAKQKLQEIAELCGVEYTITVTSDTSGVDTETIEAAANAANANNQQNAGAVSSAYFEAKDLVENKVGNEKSIEAYKNNKWAWEQSTANLENAKAAEKAFSDSAASFNRSLDNYQSGIIDQATFIQQADEAYKAATGTSLKQQFADKDYNADWYTYQYSDYFSNREGADWAYKSEMGLMSDEIEKNKAAMEKYEATVSNTATSLKDVLAADIASGNTDNIAASTKLFEDFGMKIKDVGMSTDNAATSFATAAAGYTDFAAAIEAGKAGEMAQSFINFKTQIGETAENAVQGAALIANGFENVASATEAGDAAINNVIATMQQLGSQQGLFNGLDSSGIADKLTDMAHAMDLIPSNKSITIDANGDFSVISEAENQIASLNSIGNVDVSVNANGDFSILNEATGEISTLQGMGAVSLQVNANGNIDVLDRAQQVIATIDSKSAQISVDGQAYGLDQIEQAKNAAAGLDNKSATVTATATDNASPTIAGVQNNLTALNGTTANPAITANDQASGTISSVASKLSSLDGQTATTTIITKYETQGTPPGKSAKGTPNWHGGLTYVNDQNITDPREVIREPSGAMYYYNEKNVLADIPRGSRIFTAAESRTFINGSHKNGLDRVPFDGYIAELHSGESVLTEDEAEEYRSGGDISRAVEEIIKALHDPPPNSGGGQSGGRQIVFSPHYTIHGGGADIGDRVRATGKMSFADFEEFMERYESDKRRKEF